MILRMFKVFVDAGQKGNQWTFPLCENLLFKACFYEQLAEDTHKKVKSSEKPPCSNWKSF